MRVLAGTSCVAIAIKFVVGDCTEHFLAVVVNHALIDTFGTIMSGLL